MAGDQCAPPLETEEGTWHWISDNGTEVPAYWNGTGWDNENYSPKEAFDLGWIYLTIIDPP